jgi:hypothetical protein
MDDGISQVSAEVPKTMFSMLGFETRLTPFENSWHDAGMTVSGIVGVVVVVEGVDGVLEAATTWKACVHQQKQIQCDQDVEYNVPSTFSLMLAPFFVLLR